MDPNGAFQDLWHAALKEYEKQTGTDLSTEDIVDNLATCDSIDDIFAALEKQMETFRAFRAADEKWERLKRVLKPTVHLISSLSGAAGEGVGLVFPAGKAIFVAIGVFLAATKGVSASYDSAIDLFSALKAFLDRLKIRGNTTVGPEFKAIAVKIFVELLSVLALATRLMKRKRLGQYAHILVGNKDVEDALKRLDRVMVEESAMTGAETFAIMHEVLKSTKAMISAEEGSSRELKGILVAIDAVVQRSASVLEENHEEVALKLDGITSSQRELKEGQADIRQAQADVKEQQDEETILKWLKAPDPSTNHNMASEFHHPGTGDWLLLRNDFQAWKRKESSVLWIHGKPGSGKSVLCSTIIEALKHKPDDQSMESRVAYFYFDFRDEAKQNADGFLSSLIVQLSVMHHKRGSHLRALYLGSRSGTERPSTSALIQCLENLLSTSGDVFVVLDAPDECPATTTRPKVLKTIDRLMGWRLPGVHICITSRPEADMREHIGPSATHKLNLHAVPQQGRDIVSYIHHTLRHDKAFQRWRPDNIELAIRTLSTKADGMFHWVVCQLDALKKCLPKHVRRTLQDLPKTLNETYQRVLESIDETL